MAFVGLNKRGCRGTRENPNLSILNCTQSTGKIIEKFFSPATSTCEFQENHWIVASALQNPYPRTSPPSPPLDELALANAPTRYCSASACTVFLNARDLE
jgi:hypothetical protein